MMQLGHLLLADLVLISYVFLGTSFLASPEQVVKRAP